MSSQINNNSSNNHNLYPFNSHIPTQPVRRTSNQENSNRGQNIHAIAQTQINSLSSAPTFKLDKKAGG